MIVGEKAENIQKLPSCQVYNLMVMSNNMSVGKPAAAKKRQNPQNTKFTLV
jgi:hypothetical protein